MFFSIRYDGSFLADVALQNEGVPILGRPHVDAGALCSTFVDFSPTDRDDGSVVVHQCLQLFVFCCVGTMPAITLLE